MISIDLEDPNHGDDHANTYPDPISARQDIRSPRSPCGGRLRVCLLATVVDVVRDRDAAMIFYEDATSTPSTTSRTMTGWGENDYYDYLL